MRRPLPVAAVAALVATLALSPLPASAHTGIGHAAGFTAGFLHPLGGADHLMAMVAVGLWAGLLGGRALWALPAAFLGTMALGGALGMAGVALPMAESGIVASVIVLGALAALAARLPVAAAAGLAALFGLFHGHAHGTEMLAGAGALAYGAGFLLATALLHGLGLVVGTGLGRERLGQRLARVAGGAMAVAMVALLIVQG
ncbi:HupE/UreJ family protein [Roseomonas sp. NAR14]|uniref:HupE/UreJ family protein n=1 Tax=Roseomonas acroporae TaxID=2937791 RepID=A0A9X1Y898_9PROT|nr:HupE/UreJ family protein [Roseomonas acroporae]MCK8785033.1 HupE/UreJ family protein [Roseomonas acroporae]